MMPLVDRPFVAHQIDLLRRHGVDDVDLLLRLPAGRPARPLRRRLGDWACACGYVVDPEPLGTAGAVKNAEALLDDAPFLVLNGDILTDLDLGAVVRAHARGGRARGRSC